MNPEKSGRCCLGGAGGPVRVWRRPVDQRALDASRMAPLSHMAHGVHELTLMEGIVEYVTERIDEDVGRVTLEIGERAGVDIDALRFCFGVCVADTVLAAAELDIVRVEGDRLMLKEVELR
jgi:Hydrogenase/urease nickel incorporation, metallochaperone, hypA